MAKQTKRKLDLADLQVRTLVRTIQKIEGLPPLLGAKWQRGMLDYYYPTLAKLVMWVDGADADSPDDFEELLIWLRAEVPTLALEAP